MRRMRFVLNMGMVFILCFFLQGHFSTSAAQSSNSMLDCGKNKISERIRGTGFIATKPVPVWGGVVAAQDGVVNLTKGDTLFVEFAPDRRAKPGDAFTVLSPGREISHPVTGEKMGQLIMYAGEVVVLDVKNQTATAKVSHSYRTISAGNLIVPVRPTLPESVPIRSLANFEGSIVATLEDAENVTEGEFVFIDRGTRQGLIIGDFFSIYQAESSMPLNHRGVLLDSRVAASILKEGDKFPLLKAGEGIVVDTQEDTSTLWIKKSLLGINIGDKVVSGRE